jgi:glutamate dehydrogenase (NAD(P)+)
VIGISDYFGGLYNPQGLDVPALIEHRKRAGTLRDARGNFKRMTNEELLTQDCDVLAPCAINNVIAQRNADKLQTKLVIEGANGAVTSRGARILEDRNIPVVPAMLANSGGILVNYFEWVQNRTGEQWSEGLVQRNQKRFISEAWQAMVAMNKSKGVRMHLAASMVAVERVANAHRLRGLYA